MTTEVTMYTVVCDRCGEDAGALSEEGCCWHLPSIAVEMAIEESDWHEIDGKHYCNSCVMWSSDENELIPKEPLA